MLTTIGIRSVRIIIDYKVIHDYLRGNALIFETFNMEKTSIKMISMKSNKKV